MISSAVQKLTKSIVKGDNIPRAGIPESFNVLVHELRGLGLDLEIWISDEAEAVIRNFEAAISTVRIEERLIINGNILAQQLIAQS